MEIKIDPDKMGHIEKGIPQPYFTIYLILLIILLGLIFVLGLK